MNIIYVSSSCSDSKFEELRENKITNSLPQAQKYHKLLMEGLAEDLACNVYALSAYPVNSTYSKKIFFKTEKETVGKINYIYERFLNLPVLRQLTRYLGVRKNIKKLYKQDKDCVIICDILNQSVSDSARDCGNKYGIPVIGIVTDVPGHLSGADISMLPSYQQKICRYLESRAEKNIVKYDSYLLLTEGMNSVVNKGNKPYIVIEGHCDSKMAQAKKTEPEQTHKKIMMYAGGIHKEYGIDILTYAFCDCGLEDWEFHIYGVGNFESELKRICEEYPSVKYFGQKANSYVVDRQLEATLLVNPRTTESEFVKYSFPSKTMEYMASGTAVLTTRLPGMPEEYFDYVYFFDNETREGMAATLKDVTAKTQAELTEMGRRAKGFVITEKNNIKQAKKLMDFISNIKRG